MPCTDIFDKQDAAYKESVLPSSVTARAAIEAGTTALWYKYVGLNGAVIGMDCFGESAPAKELFEHFGITTEKLVSAAKDVL
jgi:transketolase